MVVSTRDNLLDKRRMEKILVFDLYRAFELLLEHRCNRFHSAYSSL